MRCGDRRVPRLPRLWPALLAVLAALSLGASCDDGPRSGPTPDPVSAGSEAPRVEAVEQVDTSQLTRSELRVWRDLINDLLSPCGDPVSVGRCASTASRCGKCIPAARYLARLVTEGLERSEIEGHYENRYGRDRQVEIDIERAPMRGSPMAPVTIVEFSDFQCPYCGEAHPILHRLLREYEGRIRLVFMHYPLDGHVNSMPAARAAVAAENQGKFWEMHDQLFEHQGELEPSELSGYAERLGLDVARFERDIQAEETQRRVDADKAIGRRLGVAGTPSIFVNGRRFDESLIALPAYIREELEQ